MDFSTKYTFNKDLLFKLRTEAGLSKRELSDAIEGCSGHISYLESGRITNPRASVVMAIAEYFKIDIRDIMVKKTRIIKM